MSRPSRRRYDLLLTLWALAKYTHWLSKLPLLGRLFSSKQSAERNEAIIVPTAQPRTLAVHQAIQDAHSVPLPDALLVPLLEQASVRTLLNECPCRRAKRCAAYPRDLGCLFLGEGAARIHTELGRSATPEQARDQVDRAMAAGLVPTILHSAFDAYLLDIPYRRMLAVCFCCDCCCTVHHGLQANTPGFQDTVIRLPGLTVAVDESCTGCGACLQVCPVEAVSLHTTAYDPRLTSTPVTQPSTDARASARIDLERCKGCGRCVLACPSGAIQLYLADQAEVLGRLLVRIAQRTDIGTNSGIERAKDAQDRDRQRPATENQ